MKLGPIAEVRSHIQLGGVDRTLICNCNTMVAYQQATNKFFLHTVTELIKAVYPEGTGTNEDGSEKPKVMDPFEIVSKVSMVDLRALVWASMHDYDDNDNPVWPLTLNQVGRLLRLEDIVPALSAFLQAQTGNNPTASEMGESQAEGKPTKPTDAPPTTQETGGERGIELPEAAFA